MIGERLKEERVRLGLTQADFSRVANAAKRTIIEWEKNRTSPNSAQLSALSDCGVDVLYVVTGARAPANIMNSAPIMEESETLQNSSDEIAPKSEAFQTLINADLLGRVLEAVLLAYKAENARIGMRNAGELAAKIHNDILSALGADSEVSEQLIALKMAIQQLRRELQASSIAASKDKRSA